MTDLKRSAIIVENLTTLSDIVERRYLMMPLIKEKKQHNERRK